MAQVLVRVIKSVTLRYFSRWLLALNFMKNREVVEAKQRMLNILKAENESHAKNLSRRGTVALRRSLVRMARGQYAAAFSTLERNTGSRHRSRKKLIKIALRWGKNLLYYSFRRFESNVNRAIIADQQKQNALKLLNSALRKLLNSQLNIGFRRLKEAFNLGLAEKKARIERQQFAAILFLKLLKSNGLRLLFKGWKKWGEYFRLANERLWAERKMREVLVRLVHKKKAVTFYFFRKQTDQQGRSQREKRAGLKKSGDVIRIYLVRLIKQHVSKAFNKWQSLYRMRKDKSRTLKGYIIRFSLTQLGRGFESWKWHVRALSMKEKELKESIIAEELDKLRRIDRMRRVVLRMKKRNLANGFLLWRCFARMLKEIEENEKEKRLRMRRVVLRMMKRKVRQDNSFVACIACASEIIDFFFPRLRIISLPTLFFSSSILRSSRMALSFGRCIQGARY